MTVNQLSACQLEELKDDYYFDEEVNCDPDISDAELEFQTLDYYSGYDFSVDDFGSTAGQYDRYTEIKLELNEDRIEKIESWYGRRIDDEDLQKVIEYMIEEVTKDCEEIIY